MTMGRPVKINMEDVINAITTFEPWSARELHTLLQEHYGCDAKLRAVQHFLQQHGFLLESKDHFSTNVDDAKLSELVQESINISGGSWGKRMVKGYVASKGYYASERRIRLLLKQLDPEGYNRRKFILHQKRSDPARYRAPYFGYNLHMDQNEKLVLYGLIVVTLIDGHSMFIVNACIMPHKNCITIYDELFKPALLQYGMWEQVIADCGTEFNLCLFAQFVMQPFRERDGQRCERVPFRQVTSTMNNRVERSWKEYNKQLVPFRTACETLEQQEELNLEFGDECFVISRLLRLLVPYQLAAFIATWNEHPKSNKNDPLFHVGQQIPSEGLANRQNYEMQAARIPTSEALQVWYQQQRPRARFTQPHEFGVDAVEDFYKLTRDLEFQRIIRSFANGEKSGEEVLCESVMADDHSKFRLAYLQMLDVQRALAEPNEFPSAHSEEL